MADGGFREAHSRDTPASHYSIIPPFQSPRWRVGREAKARNEANFGRSFKCKVSSVKSGKRGIESSESSHLEPYTSDFRRNADCPRRMCKTKPICPAGAGRDGAWGTRGEGQMCKTKPIWPVGQSPGERNVQNEANSGRPDRHPSADYAKRSQSGWLGEAAEDEICKTKPIWRPIVQNEANSKRSFKFEVSNVKQAKPMADSSSLPTSDFTLQTFGGTPAARWAIVQNEANLRSSDRCKGVGIRPGMPAAPLPAVSLDGRGLDLVPSSVPNR